MIFDPQNQLTDEELNKLVIKEIGSDVDGFINKLKSKQVAWL